MGKVSVVKPRFDVRNWLRKLACAATNGAVVGVLISIAEPGQQGLVGAVLGALIAGALLGTGAALARSALARILRAFPAAWLLFGPIYFVFAWPGLTLGQMLGIYNVTLFEVRTS